MKKTCSAYDVPVLNFSEDPDSTGMILPTEAHCEFPDTIKVSYGKGDYETNVGVAKLRRVGTTLLANMVFTYTSKNETGALTKIAKLYPAVEFRVLEAHSNIILRLKIIGVFLTPYPNDDLNIQPLGARVKHKKKPGEMH